MLFANNEQMNLLKQTFTMDARSDISVEDFLWKKIVKCEWSSPPEGLVFYPLGTKP